MSEIKELTEIIRNDRNSMKEEISELRFAVQEMSQSFAKYYAHLAVYEEDKKHDAKFKEEVRTHIKESVPLLNYVKDQKSVTGKMKVAFYISVMFAMFGLIGFNFK
jgi:hypothetical protein